MYCCVHRYLDCIQKHEKSISFSLFHSHNQCDGTQGTLYMHVYNYMKTIVDKISEVSYKL